MDTRKPGVYLIRNLHTGDVYVGSTSRTIASRWSKHRNELIGGRHCNPRLQRAWNKYGADMFAWEVLEHAEGRDAVLACEQRWIDHYWGGRMGVDCYNMLLTAGSTAGRIVSAETRAKMRARTATPETRAKLSAAQTGHAVSPETRAKLSAATSAANRVRIISSETRAKLRAAGRGRTASPEARARMSAAGRARSPEARAKISAGRRERQRKLREKATYHQASLFDLAE